MCRISLRTTLVFTPKIGILGFWDFQSTLGALSPGPGLGPGPYMAWALYALVTGHQWGLACMPMTYGLGPIWARCCAQEGKGKGATRILVNYEPCYFGKVHVAK